jgi:hypothetical protein
LLPENCTDTLWFSGQRQVSIELMREANARYATLLEPTCKLLPESIRQNRRFKENRFDWRAVLDGASKMPDTFDNVESGSGATLSSLKRAEI